MSSIIIQKVQNSLFDSCTYVLSMGTSVCWIVDCGDVEPLVPLLKNKHLNGVLLTHAHFDHIYGLNKLLEYFPGLIVYTNRTGYEALLNDKLNLSKYHETPFVFEEPKLISIITDGDEIELDKGVTAKVIATPGHHPSCLSYIVGDALFTGDSYIPGTKVVTNLPKGNKGQSLESLNKIMQLSNNFTVYPGHFIEKNIKMSAVLNNKRIWLCLAHMSESGEEMKFIKEAFDTNWVVPLGPNVNGFEGDLEEFINHPDDGRTLSKKVVALSAGTAAIHLALVNLGVKAGDEVICQSFTFAASANPVTYQGATPVFVDSEPGTWNMDPNLLEGAIKDRIAKGKKPKAIIPVYLYGMPAYIDEIMEIAKRYEIPVLEDAAEGFGSRYRGQAVGTFGDYGVMSFNGNKMITTSGGGALICPDEETAKRILFYATQAREPFPYYQHEHIGFNYRMSNICAGIGRGQMTIVNDHLAHHVHTKDVYKEAFADIDGIELHVAPEDYMEPNYWLNTITIDPDKFGMDYEQLRQVLDKANIESRPLWKPMHMQPVFKDAPAYVNGVSEALFKVGLCLPSGPMVTDEDLAYIVETIKNAKR